MFYYCTAVSQMLGISRSDLSFWSSGEMAKQMKVKKLKNLKTLDSKPGKRLIGSVWCLFQCKYFTLNVKRLNCVQLIHNNHIYEAAVHQRELLSSVSLFVLQVCTLHISHILTEMKTSSNSFRR